MVVWLQGIDAAFLQYTVSKTMAHSASVHLLFAFEYVIQASIVTSTFIKYGLSMIDACMEGRWEHKGVYVFYLELVTDLLHLCVYLVFFVIVFTNYGLPLHLVSLLSCLMLQSEGALGVNIRDALDLIAYMHACQSRLMLTCTNWPNG